MKNLKRYLAITFCCLFAIGMITMTGCKKTSTPVDNDTSGAQDQAMAENTSNDVVNIGAQASESNSATMAEYRDANTQSLSCAMVTRDSLTKIITVTFSGGVCLDGRTRSGSIAYNFSGSTNGAMHYRDPGYSFTVTTHNYVVDGNAVNIVSKTVTNTTPLGFNYLTTNERWTVNANIIITKPDGGTITWLCNRTTLLLNTALTYPPSDITNDITPIDWAGAKIQIDGTASGSRTPSLETFSVTATALVRDFTCTPVGGGGRHPFISGELVYSPSGKATRYINYGDGTCDLIATVTINAISYTIILP